MKDFRHQSLYFCANCKIPLFLSLNTNINCCENCWPKLIENYVLCDCCGHLTYLFSSRCNWCSNPICSVCGYNAYHDDKYGCYNDPSEISD